MEIIGQGRPKTAGDPGRAGKEHYREAQSASELRADGYPMRVKARRNTAVPFGTATIVSLRWTRGRIIVAERDE